MCLGPLTTYYAKEVNVTGKRSLVFRKQDAHSGVKLEISCGKCIECKLAYARDWAVRCMHEKRMFFSEGSDFLTLTYDNDHLPPDGSVSVRELQLFMKRVRKKYGTGLRFYSCGEYGGRFKRPHYHVLFFNLRFGERRFYGYSGTGEELYTSSALSELWHLGAHYLGEVSMASCSYVAGYVAKKAESPPVVGLTPEFTLMSKGIGFSFFHKYADEILNAGKCVVDGQEVPIPRAYRQRAMLINVKRQAMLDLRQRRLARLRRGDNTSRRRRVRELVILARLRIKEGKL